MTRKFAELVRKRRVKEGSSSSGPSALGRVELWALPRSRSIRALKTLRLCRVLGVTPSSSVACPFCCFFDLPREKRRWRNPIAVAVESNKNKYHRSKHIPSCFPRSLLQTTRKALDTDMEECRSRCRHTLVAFAQKRDGLEARTSSSGPVPDPLTSVVYRSREQDELR